MLPVVRGEAHGRGQCRVKQGVGLRVFEVDSAQEFARGDAALAHICREFLHVATASGFGGDNYVHGRIHARTNWQ